VGEEHARVQGSCACARWGSSMRTEVGASLPMRGHAWTCRRHCVRVVAAEIATAAIAHEQLCGEEAVLRQALEQVQATQVRAFVRNFVPPWCPAVAVRPRAHPAATLRENGSPARRGGCDAPQALQTARAPVAPMDDGCLAPADRELLTKQVRAAHARALPTTRLNMPKHIAPTMARSLCARASLQLHVVCDSWRKLPHSRPLVSPRSGSRRTNS
jgi:hypothetical protein